MLESLRVFYIHRFSYGLWDGMDARAVGNGCGSSEMFRKSERDRPVRHILHARSLVVRYVLAWDYVMAQRCVPKSLCLTVEICEWVWLTVMMDVTAHAMNMMCVNLFYIYQKKHKYVFNEFKLHIVNNYQSILIRNVLSYIMRKKPIHLTLRN